MAEDYERAHAREWNDEPEPSVRGPPSVAWKVVEDTRHRPPPNNTPQQQKQRREAAKIANAAARPWHTHGGPVRRGHNTRREPPKLAADSDNDAEAAWRSRAKPADSVRIPDDMILKGDKDNSESWHIAIAKRHGTFLHSEHPRGSGGSRSFGIWGEKKAVEATKRAIADYIEESGYGTQKSARALKFAKIHSLTPKLRELAEKKWEREVAKQKFRQHPPPDMAFGAIGSFLWPVAEYRPEEVLGTQFEALDPVRMESKCYVVFHKERNAFRIMGKATEVKEGLQRLRKICFQIAAKQIDPVRLYLNHWPEGKLPTFIFLEPYSVPATTASKREDEDGLDVRKAPRCDEYDDDEGSIEANATADKRLLRALSRALDKLRYYQGHLQLRIRLGTFLVDQHKAPDEYGLYERPEYEDMLTESQFSGEVTHEIGDKATEDALLPALQSANELLMPADAMTSDLKDVKPIYAASFTFADPAGHYRYAIEWQQTPDAYHSGDSKKIIFDRTSKKWTRLERDAAAPTPLFDVSMCDLSTSSAWQFDILACPKVLDETKLPQQLSAFTKTLQLDIKRALNPRNEELFVRFNPYASLASVQQSVRYQYTITNSDYTAELSRFQDWSYGGRKSAISTPQPVVQEPRWSFHVFRKAWDASFAANGRLAIGKQVDWTADVKEWFPIDLGPESPLADGTEAQGFYQVLEKLKRIEGLVAEVKRAVQEDDDASM